MALHDSYVSMLRESLDEMIAVAEYCVNFEKKGIGLLPGCYGYPGAVLLLIIVDTIGAFVLDGNTEKHFQVLNDPKYYGLGLPPQAIRAIFDEYRNNLAHSSVLGLGFYLNKGSEDGPAYETKDGVPCLNLVPFLKKSKKAVSRFLQEADKIVPGSKTFNDLPAGGKSVTTSYMSISAESMPASGIGLQQTGFGESTSRK